VSRLDKGGNDATNDKPLAVSGGHVLAVLERLGNPSSRIVNVPAPTIARFISRRHMVAVLVENPGFYAADFFEGVFFMYVRHRLARRYFGSS